MALGLDFGRVIMCPPEGVEGADTEFLTLPEDEALEIAPPAGAFQIIAALVLKFQERRKFGSLSVARDSAVAVWFDVAGS